MFLVLRQFGSFQPLAGLCVAWPDELKALFRLASGVQAVGFGAANDLPLPNGRTDGKLQPVVQPTPSRSMTRRKLTLLLAGATFISGFCLMTTAGCGRGQDRRKAKSVVHLRWFIAAILAFKDAEGSFPERIEDLEDWYAEGKGNAKMQAAFAELRAMGVSSFKGVLANPRTGSNPGYKYVRPTTEVFSDPVVLQLQGGEELGDKSAAYLDGTVR